MILKSRKSPRKQGYDYTTPGAYFVTICTKDRRHYFGDVVDGKMVLNKLGIYVTEHRNHISDHYPFVVCDTFVCMPNHIHGILIIGDHISNRDAGTQFFASSGLKDGIQPKSGSLGSIIRGFKIGITKYAKQNNLPFVRQGRYHDHIIRNNNEYERIKWYIKANPENWNEDTLIS